MNFKEFLDKYDIPYLIETIDKEIEHFEDEYGNELTDMEESIIVDDEDLFHYDKELKQEFPNYKYNYEYTMIPKESPKPNSPNN